MTTTLRLFARSRGGTVRLGVLALLAALPILLAPVSYLGVPVRDAAASIFLNAALLGGTVIVFPLGAPWVELDESLPDRPLRDLRLTWFVTVTLTVVLVGAVAVAVRQDAGLLLPFYARNVLLGVGIGALSVCLLPRTIAWLPVTAYAMVCWVWGTQDQLGTARAWALPNYELSSPVPLVVAVCLWAATAVMYSYRDGRQVP
ncbi:hypothetical protein AA0Y32_14950 [Georgenia phoenicis]|uniref:hypothetical protein n=1 Tax=unclassified Georgenia TaxID=2626815 RepID=UPI0039AEBD5A